MTLRWIELQSASPPSVGNLRPAWIGVILVHILLPPDRLPTLGEAAGPEIGPHPCIDPLMCQSNSPGNSLECLLHFLWMSPTLQLHLGSN